MFAGLRATRTVRPRAASELENSNTAKAVAIAGLVANPVVLVSEYFLKTTGEGLPPGPGGIYGATEGVSYLVIVGIAAWSIYKKVKTGSGLPGTLLGAAEGLSFLSIVAGKQSVLKQHIHLVLCDKLCQGLPCCPVLHMCTALLNVYFLSSHAGIIVAGLEIAEKGSLPGITGR